ncbi:hypothetical protein E2C01_047750 [Portunus trituberculatus]|uniref:Uncharacterized protein n=1 Tax=Portunus trituberculatus TaxID=210409 RepID=A0A5B7G9P1_PORTR|nr:hypothetical protein [Portunus trituberculatus]
MIVNKALSSPSQPPPLFCSEIRFTVNPVHQIPGQQPLARGPDPIYDDLTSNPSPCSISTRQPSLQNSN